MGRRDKQRRTSRPERERSRTPDDYSQRRVRPSPRRDDSVSRSSGLRSEQSERFFEKMVDRMERMEENAQQARSLPRSIDGKHSIPKFDPTDAHQTVENWLHKIEDLRADYGWSDATTAAYMVDKLRGTARTWYDGLTTLSMPWVEWRQRLIEAFADGTRLPERIRKMITRMKRADESMSEYYFDKIALVNACNYQGKDAVEFVIDGISDISVRNTALGQRFDRPEKLHQFLMTLAVAPTKDEGRDRSKRAAQRAPGSTKRAESDRRGRRAPASPSPPNKRGAVVCYNCDKQGHIARDCRRPKENRGNKEHRENKENRGKRESGDKKNVMSVRAGAKAGTAYFQNVMLGDATLRAFIDMGSECITLREDEARNLGLKLEPSATVIRGYAGGMTRSLGTTRAVLKVDLAEAEVDVLVVPNELQDIPLIIGQPFTDLETVSVVRTGDVLRIFDASVATLPQIEDLPAQKHALWAKEATVIPPNHIANVKVMTKDTDYIGDLFVELGMRREEGREHLVPRCIINTACGVIPVVNLSDSPLRIEASQVVARGVPAEEGLAEGGLTEENKILQLNAISMATRQELPASQIHIGESIPEVERSKLLALLNVYRSCFALGTDELGKTEVAEMKIELTSDGPVTYRPYRLSYTERDKVREITADLKKHGIIRDSNSPFASPILLVKKKNGEVRMCVDYRALNAITKKDRYPLPLIEDQLNNLQGNAYFTSLDLASGYYQIPVAKDSVEKTSFVTPDGQYEFLRMPFGLANGPAVFQRVINKIIAPLKDISVMAYMDDILIPSKSVEQGLRSLGRVLAEFQKAGLTLNLDKCTFFQTKIDYLGYEVTAEGIRPGQRKIEAVSNFPEPRDVHGLRQFVGLASYFRKFVKNFATIAKPLTSLTKKGVDWGWGTAQQEAFDEIKKRLVSRPLLALYDQYAETELHTDASKLGVGGILIQKQSDGAMKPVAYFSRQTSKEEQRYHSYELETLAVVESLQRFRVYLLGLKFKVVSDCSSLRATFVKRDLIPRIGRWWIRLQEYSGCSIEYRPGSKMPHVDALSRNAITGVNDSDVIDDVSLLHVSEADWLLTAQLQDNRLAYIHDVLLREAKDVEEQKIKAEYCLKDNRVFRQTIDGLRWAVPRSVRRQIVKVCHDDMGHFGLGKTLSKVQADYWFPSMRQYVKKYVSSCLNCLYTKEPAGKKSGYLNSIDKVPTPFHTLHVDHLGPFVKSTAGNSYLIVAVDAFTKFVFMKAIASTKSILVERFLSGIAETFGFPKRLISDRGSAFTSKAFKEYISTHGIKHVLTAVATPRANGQVERYNRSILAAISASIGDERKWDKQIAKVKWGLNNTINKTTGKCPAELIFGYRPRGPTEAQILNAVTDDARDENIEETRRQAYRRTCKAQAEQKERYDKKRAAPKVFKVDDIVLVRRTIASNDGSSKKTLPRYAGPYRVAAVLDLDRYSIEDIPGAPVTQKPYEGIVPSEKLKPWNTIVSDDDSEEGLEDERENE